MVYAPDPGEVEGWGILTSDEDAQSEQYYAGYEVGYRDGWDAARQASIGDSVG